MKKVAFFVIFLVLLLPIQAFAQNPDWVRDIAYWWSQGQISDTEFNDAIKYLIEKGVIIIKNQNIPIGNNIKDGGDFYITYEPTEQYKELSLWLKNNEEWVLNISHINEIKLPYDIEIIYRECGEANAAYYSEGFIEVCYELVEQIIEIQSRYYFTEEEIRMAVQDTTYFIFLHELGHALIDVYDIPYTGKQEDAVDQLATIILLTENEQGVNALFATSNYWHELGSEPIPYETLPFHDEHSFELQRFYSILCFVYGNDPVNSSDVLNLIPDSSDNIKFWQYHCVNEHNVISNNWNMFLEPLWN